MPHVRKYEFSGEAIHGAARAVVAALGREAYRLPEEQRASRAALNAFGIAALAAAAEALFSLCDEDGIMNARELFEERLGVAMASRAARRGGN